MHIPSTLGSGLAEAGSDAGRGGVGAATARVANAMVKALVRAFRWRTMLDEGVHAGHQGMRLRRAGDLALTDGFASFGYSLSCLLMIFRVGLRRFLVHLGLGLILERREDWEMVRSDVSEPLQTD